MLPGATKAGALGIFDFCFLSFDLVKGGGGDIIHTNFFDRAIRGIREKVNLI